MPQSLYCTLASNPTSLPKFEPLSCPVSQVLYSSSSGSDSTDETNAWFFFISQIGYTNAHALLSLYGIIATLSSLSKTLGRYSRLTGSLAVTFLTGFFTNFLNYTHLTPILSCLAEILLFSIHMNLSFISLKPDFKNAVVMNTFLVVFYVLPCLVWFILVCVHVGNGFNSTGGGGAIKYASVLIWVLRCFLGGIVLVRGRGTGTPAASGTDGIETGEEKTVCYIYLSHSFVKMIVNVHRSMQQRHY
ncbi:UNVERIFIED_CONTAM: hypothetical protein HDU68_011250 [Siphonaria sp. JEL0065]|nr:hypothetical protein HDU68_011250 [Siphonaria sp. JEL0065]